MSPYIALIESRLAEILAVIQDTSTERPKILTSIFIGLRDEFSDAPEDITKAFSVLLKEDADWVAQNATPMDLFIALETIDEVNDFVSLWFAAKYLGMINYG